MIVIGSGLPIDGVELRIKPGFKVNTKLALQWAKTQNGNYYATDRGASSDIYESEVRLVSTEAEVNSVVEAVYINRVLNGSNVVYLTGFSDTEHIFGADLDYSSTIQATVVSISPIEQRGFKTREMQVKFRALSPSFTGTPGLPPLQCLDYGYKAEQVRSIKKYDSYNGTYYYQDMRADTGVFEGVFTLATDDMITMRRYITTERGNIITIPNIAGVAYPFGPNRTYTYPIDVKIIDWDDQGMWGLGHWKLKLTLAEVV